MDKSVLINDFKLFHWNITKPGHVWTVDIIFYNKKFPPQHSITVANLFHTEIESNFSISMHVKRFQLYWRLSGKRLVSARQRNLHWIMITYPSDVDTSESLHCRGQSSTQSGHLGRGPVLSPDQHNLICLGEWSWHLCCNLKMWIRLIFHLIAKPRERLISALF